MFYEYFIAGFFTAFILNMRLLQIDQKSIIQANKWLGWQDSNLRMPGSKPGALPLGDTPKISDLTKDIEIMEIGLYL